MYKEQYLSHSTHNKACEQNALSYGCLQKHCIAQNAVEDVRDLISKDSRTPHSPEFITPIHPLSSRKNLNRTLMSTYFLRCRYMGICDIIVFLNYTLTSLTPSDRCKYCKTPNDTLKT